MYLFTLKKLKLKNMKKLFLAYIIFATAFLFSCCEEEIPNNAGTCGENLTIDWNSLNDTPTAYELNIPQTFQNIASGMNIPPDNQLTEEGVALGRMLFYDPILSGDSTQSCASCHNASFAFTDNGEALSIGIDGIAGNRNAMALFNLAWVPRLFWDGRSETLEEQALEPVPNPIELHQEWPDAVCKLMNSEMYRKAFYEAFGTKEITPTEVTKAIAQFERTMISGNSKFDLAITPGSGVQLTKQEELGYALFIDESGGDCFHCHVDPAFLFTDNQFHNNGLDEVANLNDFADKGLGEVTGEEADNGLFRTPTLRNIALTAPYMHDGRFETLEEVLDHYSEGIKSSPNLDFIIQADFGIPGKQLTQTEKEAIIAFLHTLTDTTFINNPAFSNPFE